MILPQRGILLAAPGVRGSGQPDRHDLMGSGAGHKGLAGVGQDGNIGRARAARKHASQRERPLVRGADGIDGDTARGAIANDHGAIIRSDSGQPRALTRARDGDLPAQLKVQHRNGVGSGVGHVCAPAFRVDADEIWSVVDTDGMNDPVLPRVDHGDGVAARIDRIHFIALRVRGQAGRLAPDLQRALRAKIDEVEHGDAAGGAVRDVGVFAVAGGKLGKAVAMAAGERPQAGSQERSTQTTPWRLRAGSSRERDQADEQAGEHWI